MGAPTPKKAAKAPPQGGSGKVFAEGERGSDAPSPSLLPPDPMHSVSWGAGGCEGHAR